MTPDSRINKIKFSFKKSEGGGANALATEFSGGVGLQSCHCSFLGSPSLSTGPHNLYTWWHAQLNVCTCCIANCTLVIDAATNFTNVKKSHVTWECNTPLQWNYLTNGGWWLFWHQRLLVLQIRGHKFTSPFGTEKWIGTPSLFATFLRLWESLWM